MTTKFKFKDTTADEMYSKMISLDSKIATPEGHMSVDLLKCIGDIIAGTVADIYNENTNKSCFCYNHFDNIHNTFPIQIVSIAIVFILFIINNYLTSKPISFPTILRCSYIIP